jgi:hypothetical protein
MEVEYVLQMPDLVAFQRFHERQRRKARQVGRIIGVVVGLLLAAGMLILQYLDLVPLLFSLLCLIVGTVLLVLTASLLLRWSLRAQLRRRAADWLGWHRLSINPEGLVVATETSRYETKWVTVRRIARDGDYAFLYLTDTSAIILPRRPFVSDEEFDRFVATARRYRRAAPETTCPKGSTRREQAREPDTNITPDERAGL